jgi:hypothetical protein
MLTFQDRILGQAKLRQAPSLGALRQAQQQVLGRDVFILHPLGIALGGCEDVRGGAGQADLAGSAIYLRTALQIALDFFAQRLDRPGDLGDHRWHDAILLAKQG